MRLNQVTLAVSDLDRSVAFYRSLGLEQIVADEDYARFACPDGESTLSVRARCSLCSRAGMARKTGASAPRGA